MAAKGAYYNMATNHWPLSINKEGKITNCVLGRNYLQMVGFNDITIKNISTKNGFPQFVQNQGLVLTLLPVDPCRCTQ